MQTDPTLEDVYYIDERGELAPKNVSNDMAFVDDSLEPMENK